MRLDHLLSKEEEVKVVLLFSCQRELRRKKRNRSLNGNVHKRWSFSGCIGREPGTRAGKACESGSLGNNKILPVAMRFGGTPVPIPNTMVKTNTADDTWLETTWESRWLPDFISTFFGDSI